MVVCTALPAVNSARQITCTKCTVTYPESGRMDQKHCILSQCSVLTGSIHSTCRIEANSEGMYRQFEHHDFQKSGRLSSTRIPAPSEHNTDVKFDSTTSFSFRSLFSHSSSNSSSSFSSNVFPLCVTIKPVKISSSNSCSRVADHLLYLISLFVTLLMFSQLTIFASAAPCTSCPSVACNCYLDTDSNCIINCTSKSLTENPIKSGLDPNTTQILLRNNQISKFGEISSYTNLVILDMADNVISTVPENLFTEMSSLTKLDLSNNVISSLKSSQLEGLTELKQLYLHGNLLTQLLHPVMQVLPKVQNITLSGNNWTCTCHLEWLQTTDKVQGDLYCSEPPSLAGRLLRDVDLRSVRCAPSYVSCVSHSTEKKYIVWEYTDLNTSVTHDKKSCNTLCLLNGFHYASVYSNTICLCAGDTTNSLGSTSCSLDCSKDPLPATACGKTIVQDAPFATGPLLVFEGVKIFSVEETVEITIIPALTVPVDYVWDFNDSTAIMTTSTTLKHKYALPGTYYITISVNQFLFTYLISIIVEEPIKGVAIHCPRYAEPDQPLNITVDVKHGTKPRLKWMSKAADGEIEYDDSFKLSSAEFFERTQTAYSVIGATRNWTVAREKCVEFGGLLAVIDNQNVTDFILSDVISGNSASLFWIGIGDGGFAGTLVNAYRQVLSDSMYSNWADGEPDEHISQFVTPGWCVAIDKSDRGKWKTLRCSSELNYICQYRSSYHVEEPQNFIAGPTEFQTKGSWTNLTAISSQPTISPGEKAYVLLFPGIWLKHGGLMKRWEFTGQSKTVLRLQLYRPTCTNSKKAVRPGCKTHSSPFLTCANASAYGACRKQVTPCTQGHQYCSITHTCKALSEPCSRYSSLANNDVLSRHSLDSLSYVLVSQHIVSMPEEQKNSYQVFVRNNISVRMDDVIGVAFSQTSFDTSDLSQIPLHCQKSNLSKWRQSALLVMSNSFAGMTEELNLTKHEWVDLIWCDIRLKFTEATTSHRTKSPFLTPKVPGNFTYSLVAFNNVSQTTLLDEPQSECVVEVRDRVVSVSIAAPLSSAQTPEGYPIIHVPTGVSQAIALRIEGGGLHVITHWTGIPSGSVETLLQARCPSSLANTTPSCSGRADANLRISTTNVTLDADTTIRVTARNPFSSAGITIRVATGEAITGLKILPENTSRILSSVPLVFTAHVDTGSDVSYTWVIDDLTQYAYTSQEYNVLFRTQAFYDLKLTATNLVGTESVSITVNVDSMNQLADLQFVGLPDISQRNVVLVFEVKFLVDENVDYQTKWLFEGSQEINGPVVPQPHSGVRPDSSIESVERTISENYTFSTTGEKTVKITVFNDYDSLSVEKTVDIRERLESVSITMTSEVPATKDSLQFECSAVPSTYATEFQIDWGDGNRRDFSEDSTPTHSYDNPGTYVINATGNNEINAKWNTTNITVYERITGLTVTSDGPTEINLVTTVTASIDTGLGSAVYSFDFGSSSISAVVNDSSSVASDTYASIGKYNVTVLAANPVSSQQSVIEILVFEIRIVEVNATAECFKFGTNATVHAYMPTDRLDLFEYVWDLGGLGTRTIDSDNRLDQPFSVGLHKVNVKVKSKKSGVFDEESVSICVQEEIADATITVTSPAVEVNSDSEFNLVVSGGTNNSYVVDFGDGSTPASQSTLGRVTYKYNSTGNYTVVFSASNLVSQVNDTVVAIVQEAVKGISVKTDSDYGTSIAKDYEVTYMADTTNGTDLNYSWDFGDGSAKKYGQNIVHKYSAVGNYTITLVVSNLVSSETYELTVAVKEPVSGAAITPNASLVRVNSTVHFTASATNGGPTFTYSWKEFFDELSSKFEDIPVSVVNPGQNFTLGTESFTYKFNQILNYSITVKIENEVSADYAEVFVLAADDILAINISTENLVEGKYAAHNESTDFKVLLDTGEPISSTTAGFTGPLDFFWTITIDGALEDTYQGSATISHTFLNVGLYTMKVNVTNGVSTHEATIEVVSIERIGEISFKKLVGFEGASATGDTVKLQALVTKGTDARYFWTADDGSPESTVNSNVLSHVYRTVGTFYPHVTVSNVFGNRTDSYELVVQDKIEGLEVMQVDSIVEFYVALSRKTNFKANVTKGTDVEYSWYYIDKGDGTMSDIENSTNNYMLWSFPKLTTYRLRVNASNRVHWADVEYIVTVIRPIFRLELDTASLSVATNSRVEFNASVASGDGVGYRFFVNDILKSGSILSELLSQLSILLDTPGTFEITVEASNNVSVENVTKTISVLDPIVGPAITGCCVSEQYYALEDNHTFIGEIQSGSNVSYDWTVTYENDEVEQATGKEIHLVLSYVGRTEVKLSLMNEVSSKIISIFLHMQERPKVSLSVEDPGRSLYTEENITLIIVVERGTNVTHSVNFHDNTSLESAEDSTELVHVYHQDGVYTIKVISSNNVDSVTNTVLVQILKLQCKAPTISFVESIKSSRFFRSATIYVEATVLINCTAYDVDYNWSIYMQTSCTDLVPGNLVWPNNQWIGINSNRPLLVLPRLTLEVNTYCFSIIVSFQDTYLSTSSSVLLEVLSTPLTVIIAGGTILFISEDSSLTLDAGKSFDPDQPSDLLQDISFEWLCEATAATDELEYGYIPGKTDTYACPIIPDVTASKFSVPSGSLSEGGEYKYTVIARKNGKTATSAWQKIIVVRRTIPTATINCYSCDISASYRISASFHVGLRGTCVTCSSTDTVSYLWSLTRREIGSTAVTDVAITDDMTTTGVISPYIVIKEGALVNSYEYEFKLKISTGDLEGFSKLVLSPNIPPSNGTCLMNYSGNTIYVLETLVSFHCSNWSDEEEQNKSPLVYTIIAASTAADEENDNAFILYRGTQKAYQAYLPLGFAPDYMVNIRILVEDQLGTSTVGLDENVRVIHPELKVLSTITWLQQKTNNELEALLKMNDPQDIIDFCAAAITVSNSISSEYNYNALDSDYLDLVMIREKITMTVANIDTTTLKDVQQIASVLKQSVLVPAELQNPTTQRAVLENVNDMVVKMAEYIDRNGHSTFEQTSNEILDIIGGMIRAINYVVYNEEIANQISSVAVNVSVNYTKEYRMPMITDLLQNIDDLILTILKSKVLGEEAVDFRSTVFSISSIRTTPRRISRSVSIAGCTYTLPDHLFENLDPDREIFSIAKTYEQNPFTFGYPSSNLGSNGFANITSRVLSLQIFNTDGTLISVDNIASQTDGNDRRIRMSMTTSSKQHLTDSELAAISAQPQAELDFTTERLDALKSMVVTLTNDNRDLATSAYIMVTYDHLSTVSKTEPNPVVSVYFDFNPRPNAENHTTVMQLTDSVMANSSYHQAYTLYFEQAEATVPKFYLNISNFFKYHDINVNIAIYYTQCLFFNESTQKWIDDGLRTSSESSFTLSVCYSNHLTSFGSFVINPPNVITIDDITDIDFSQSRVTLIVVSVIMLLYIIGLIWARRLDLRDIKNASLIPLCGSNNSHKYEITIKTGAGMGSGTSANVGICIYGYDSRTGSRHLYKKEAFVRGAVDTLQIAHDVSLGTIYKIKIWHDNTGLDPGWYVDRVMVKDIQTGEKYYFLINSWLQVYPDDDDETCLEKTVRVASEEELTNFSQIFGSQMSYGWEDAHLWLSVIDRPARSRFTRVQRVTCCVTLLLIFMVFSAFWYQGYDEDGEVSTDENVIGLLRWKDIAVGAIVSLMTFPLSLVIVCVFKKSKSKVAALKPWSERVQTAKTIEILDEIIDGGGRRFQRTPAGGSIYDDDFDDDEYEMSTLRHNQLPGQNEFLAEYFNDNSDGVKESSFFSRSQTPISKKSKAQAYEANISNRSQLHKASGTLKSLDINDKIWSSDDSAIQMSGSSSSSGIAGSTIDIEVSSSDERASSANTELGWPNRTSATQKGLLHFQSEGDLRNSDKKVGVDTTSVRSESNGGKRKKSPSRQEIALARAGSASPPNFIPDDEDDLNDDEELWNLFMNDDGVTQVDEDLILTNKQVNLRRTRAAKFTEEDEIPGEETNRGLVLDDVITSQSDEDSDESDVPLPDLPLSRGRSSGRASQGSVLIGTSPQPSSESFLLPHWCIYANYAACLAAMVLCIFFIIVYGSKFGPDTSTRWLLSMLIALLESFFIIEPVKVVLFAVFLAMVTKPINPEENDNLVEEPHVENYGQMHTFNKVRAPGGFALSKCKKEAKKTQRSDKLLLNLAVYLIFLSSVAAVASWDRDTMSFHATGAVQDALFTSNFTFPNDSDGISRENNSATFYQVATSSDIWEWLIQVFAVKIFDNDLASLDNEISNNVLLGKVRLRQQRVELATCLIDTDKREYGDLTEPGRTCKTTQQTKTSNPGDLSANYSTWNDIQGQFSVPMYWGENLMYDDSGYSEFFNASLNITEAQLQLLVLQSVDWFDRETAVVFVEFTLLNPATNWFMVTVLMFEMGVTGAVRPSYSIQTVRLFRPSSAFFVDMLFMSFVGIIGIFLLVRELKKICNPRCTASLYFCKWTNWVNITVLALTMLLCIFYMYKEIYLEDVMQKYIKDNQAFTNFYKVAFHSNLVTYTATLLLAVIIMRAARLLRFIKSFSVFGKTLSASARYLFGATLMLLLLVFTYAMLGYLVFGQSYPYVVEDFRDYPNSIYAMFRTFRGKLNVRVCYDANPAFSIFFFLTYYFGIFFIFSRIFAAIIINEYKAVQRRKKAMRFDVPDYEILNHMITRLKMRLGIIKPKQFRPNVRFEGMSTPSSRGSFMSIDSFDTCFMPGRISQCSDATGISSSSSDSGLGTPSDHSVSVFDYLTLEQPSDRPLDTLHLDYLYSRLSNYSVDMMLHRLDRVNKLGDEVLGLETDILKVTERVEQRKKMKSQSKEIAAAASSMTSQPNYIPPESEQKQKLEDGSTTFSSRGHFSLQSQQNLSQISLSSGRRSSLSNDSRFQTVLNIMFPNEDRQSGMSDISRAELGHVRRPPVRTSSYTGLSASQRSPSNKSTRGTISSANADLRSEGNKRTSSSQHTVRGGATAPSTVKQRPHSDEGVRVNAPSMVSQSKHSRRSLNDVYLRSSKQSSQRADSRQTQSESGKASKGKYNPLAKKSAW